MIFPSLFRFFPCLRNRYEICSREKLFYYSLYLFTYVISKIWRMRNRETRDSDWFLASYAMWKRILGFKFLLMILLWTIIISLFRYFSSFLMLLTSLPIICRTSYYKPMLILTNCQRKILNSYFQRTTLRQLKVWNKIIPKYSTKWDNLEYINIVLLRLL